MCDNILLLFFIDIVILLFVLNIVKINVKLVCLLVFCNRMLLKALIYEFLGKKYFKHAKVI